MVQGYRLRGAVDVDTLCRNTAALLVNHPTLRTAYTLGPDGDLTATVLDPPAAPPVRVLNAGTGGEEQAAALVATQAAEEFDLAEPPLARVLAIRITDDRHWVVIIAHHIAMDGDSFAPIWTDLLTRPGPPAPGYPRHIEDSLRYRAADEYAAHLDFWGARADELDATLRAMTASEADGDTEDTTSFDVSAEDWGAVIELARSEAVTPFTVVVAALAHALCRLLGLDRVAIGIPVSTRTPGVEQARVVGNHLNIVPVVFRPAGAGEVGDVLFDALEHAVVPLEEILRLAADARDLRRQPVSVTATSFAAAGQLDTATGPAEPVLVVQGSSKTALSLYLEIHRRHATVYVAGGLGLRLLPTRLVAEEVQREMAALTR